MLYYPVAKAFGCGLPSSKGRHSRPQVVAAASTPQAQSLRDVKKSTCKFDIAARTDLIMWDGSIASWIERYGKEFTL